MSDDYKNTTLRFNKVLNEEDVFPLHIIRVVCESAGLIHKRKDKILVTKKHQRLLSDENAGKLYHLLFITYFKQFNLAYLDRLPELYSIQGAIAYSFMKLKEICNAYIPLDGLQEKILLPAVLDEIEESLPEKVFVEWVIGSRIIQPLEELGLLECLYKKEEKEFSHITDVKKSQLFDKFMKVE